MTVAKSVRKAFAYNPDTGRLTRIERGLGARVGVEVGYIAEDGYRRAHYRGKGRQTAHLVWAWHYGEFPKDRIVRKNHDRADDRIENLSLYVDTRTPVQASLPGMCADQYEDMRGDLHGVFNRGVYEIRNINNGRRYIGSAVNVSKRWRYHIAQLEDGSHANRFLKRCWKKHSRDAFVFRLILACKKKDLIMYEQACIDAMKPEYNAAKVAGSQLGFKHSSESRMRMSLSAAGNSNSKGKKRSAETCRKISASKKGVKFGKYGKDRVSKAAAEMRKSKSSMTEDSVREIRRLRGQGKTYMQIAELSGCTWFVVADIIRKRTFSWVK